MAAKKTLQESNNLCLFSSCSYLLFSKDVVVVEVVCDRMKMLVIISVGHNTPYNSSAYGKTSVLPTAT